MAESGQFSSWGELVSIFQQLAKKTGKDTFQSSASSQMFKQHIAPSGQFKGFTHNDVENGANAKMYVEEKKKAGKQVKYFTINEANVKMYLRFMGHYCLYKKNPKISLDDPKVEEMQCKLAQCICDAERSKPKEEKKNAAVVNRLTDTSGYTGAHKSRFGEDGKGKGLDGREDRHDNSGYVGQYKHEGTYGKK